MQINKIFNSIGKIDKRDKFFFFLISAITIVFFFIPTGFENSGMNDSLRYEKGLVESIDNSDLHQISIVTIGTQKVKIRILSGKFKGQEVDADNVLLGQKKLDKIFKVGDKVLTILQLNDAKTKCIGARAADFYRQGTELFLFMAFALFLIFFAKFIGLKAVISFIFTAVVFWKLLIPGFLKGYNPLVLSILIVFICSIAIILLVGGVNKKGFVALFGTMTGISITALLATVFGYYFKIPGAVQEYSEALLYTGFVDLDLSNIFISVIFISAAGAVMDVSMDISTAQSEIINRVPNLSRTELIKSGFRIARPVLGSMTTTLLFAYSGSFMFAFMAFMAKGTNIESIVNKNYIAAEILHTLVGSFGLILVAPVTAIIGGYIYKWNKNAIEI